MSHLGVFLMRLLAFLPLAWLRALGWLLGGALFVVVPKRRRIAARNLELCYPKLPRSTRRALTLRLFIHVAQSWLDRSWLWHASERVVRKRLRLTGATAQLDGSQPTVVFAPHFVGMDAGWTALTLHVQREFTGIYTDQSNKVVDAWALKGRHRFGHCRPFARVDGVRAIVSALRHGSVLYLLPDMNFGPEESIFVPFFGVPAATLPSLSRFARLGHAKVVPVVTRMTRHGYDVEVLPAWSDFPSRDLVADTALMNVRLQQYIDTMPEQYYWVHQRFKSRPPGQPPVY